MIPVKTGTFLLLATLTLGLSGCDKPAPPVNVKPVATTDPTPRPAPRTPLEKELNYIANENFVKILVFTRLDNGVFVKDDFDFLKANAPVQTNQWLKTDDGLHVIAATNFPFSPEQMTALSKRFKIDDQSAEYGRKADGKPSA